MRLDAQRRRSTPRRPGAVHARSVPSKRIQEPKPVGGLDAVDPSWLPEPIEDWTSDTELLGQYAALARDG